MLDQSDFLVVGVIGKQGVGKSTVMSLLAGTRTGANRYAVLKVLGWFHLINYLKRLMFGDSKYL